MYFSQADIEAAVEEMTAMKFEKLAEVKANYDMMLKRLKPDQHADKIDKLKGKKEDACTKVKLQADADKKEKIAEIKEKSETRKRELQQLKDSKLESLQN